MRHSCSEIYKLHHKEKLNSASCQALRDYADILIPLQNRPKEKSDSDKLIYVAFLELFLNS